ncbi:glucose repression mediator protein [Malassezia brasiliensis]|uniref:Glucose repression mediator protein n=1 Tax=Malassezia brasiliensis TaxID=1821822 RepID=A0AAF0IM29_9BASI|nr:glucose repression mediator protein [Malassezia brasiliensis]
MAPANESMPPILSKLTAANEQTWLSIGSAAEAMEDYTRALSAYDSALLHNPYSVPALSAMATMYRTLDHFDLAVECFQRVLNITPDNGEVWGAMGHCYLMMDELQKAYTAYHQALYHLPNPKEPKLWYGIGILYDRYGSLEHAEETFTSVVRMDPNYEKANEIYFRLGIIYKQQGQYESSLECFRYILNNPPKPLTEMDIWFQIGHVYEQQEEYQLAKEAYERVLSENPNHAKVLQQLGGLYMQSATGFSDRETAIQLLSQSLDSDPSDPKAWYLLGRAYMDAEEYNKAYEAYQQTVYRDGKNPVLWCSIGILYFQISQYHDALGAYSRSIRLNPYIPEIWFNLGILYESCNNQISDAIDAYRRVLELEPENTAVQHRLQLLQDAESSGKPVPSIPAPRDVNPALFFTAAPPPGSPHPADEAREGTESAARPPQDTYLPPHDTTADSSVDFPKGMHAPPDIDTPPRRRADDAHRTSPKLPSYAATYADYRHETAGPGYGGPGPASNRYYQAAPYEWDRQYYGGGYEPGARGEPMPPSMAGPRSSSMRYAYDAPSERAHYDIRTGRPYNSMRSPGMAAHTPRGPDEYHEEPPRESAALDARRTRRPGAEPRRARDAPEARSPRVTPAEATRKPNGSAARMSKPEARPEPPRASVPASAPLRTREVDEDYDDGAASALMGLAGAAASAYEASNAERQRELEASSNQAGKHTIEAPVAPEPAKRARSDAEAPSSADMSVDEVAPKRGPEGSESGPALGAAGASGEATSERP